MAELSGGGNHGSLSGTNKVEIVATPSTGMFRMVRSIYFNHTDSETVVIHLAKKVSGVWYQIHSQLMIQGYTIEFGDGDMIILAEGESLEAWLDSSPSTNPTFISSYGDKG